MFYNGFQTVVQAYFGLPLVSLQMFVYDANSQVLGDSPTTHHVFREHYADAAGCQMLERLLFRSGRLLIFLFIDFLHA